MLDKYVLKKILDSRFTGRILSKGYQLYTSGEVKLIEFDDHNHSYEAQVNDGQLFTVQFDYSNSEIGASLSCDCKDFTNCAHQSALVYFLYHQLKSDKKELLFQTTNTGFNNTSLSSNYRTIDYSSGMFQALNRYKKAVKTWFDFDIINIELTSRSEITTTLGRRAKYYKNDFVLLGDVIIQSLNETTCQIKCNVCSKNSKFLCEHQQLTIQHMVHLDFDQYIFRSDEAEHEIQKLAMEKYGVSKENIAKHFSFLCAGSGRITVVPKSKAAQKNTAFLDAIRDVVPIDIALSERIQEIKKVDQLSASILWLPYEEDEICTIIKGKKRKADGVLSTKIEIVKDSNKLDEVDFIGSNLYYTNLSDAYLFRARFDDVNLRNADLSNTTLIEADFVCADLSNADLSKSILWDVDFNSADLKETSLKMSDLTQAIFNGADLGGADLGGADLSGVDFSGTILSGVKLRSIGFSETDDILNSIDGFFENIELNDAKGLEKDQLLDALTLFEIKALNSELEVQLQKEKPCLFTQSGCGKE